MRATTHPVSSPPASRVLSAPTSMTVHHIEKRSGKKPGERVVVQSETLGEFFSSVNSYKAVTRGELTNVLLHFGRHLDQKARANRWHRRLLRRLRNQPAPFTIFDVLGADQAELLRLTRERPDEVVLAPKPAAS